MSEYVVLALLVSKESLRRVLVFSAKVAVPTVAIREQE